MLCFLACCHPLIALGPVRALHSACTSLGWLAPPCDPLIVRGCSLQNLVDSGFLDSRSGEQHRDLGFKGPGRAANLQAIISATSGHAHEVALIHAMLVAGLYPNISALSLNRGRPPDCFTDEDGKVAVHPSSLLGSLKGEKYM